MLMSRLTGTCSVSPFLAAGSFLLSRCLALQTTGFPSAPPVPGRLPGGWGAAQPAEGGQQSCIHRFQSQLQFEPSKAEPRGPTTGKGAVRGVPAQPPARSQELMGTPLRDQELEGCVARLRRSRWHYLAQNGVRREGQAFPLQ